MGNRILITGAGGFLGTHICRYFGEQGFATAGVDKLSPVSKKSRFYPGMGKICRMMLPDNAFVAMLREFKPELIVHCAGPSSVTGSMKDPYDDFQHNVQVTAFVLECIRKQLPESTFILLSSAAVYGNPDILPVTEEMPCKPISPYGHHKLMCETLAQEFSMIYKIPIAIVRIFSAYGEGAKKQVIYDLCNKFAIGEGNVVEVYGTGNESRDFIHAVDVARAIECIYTSRATGVFNVASGVKVTIAELVQMINKSFNSTKTVRYTGSVRQGDPLFWQANIKKISLLGFYQTVSFQNGLHGYCRWFESELKGE
jgi:UDP-glucose 4-epimerase